MTYLGIKVGMEIFDFGGLKCKFSMVPGWGSEYDGTAEEKQKHDNYVEWWLHLREFKCSKRI